MREPGSRYSYALPYLSMALPTPGVVSVWIRARRAFWRDRDGQGLTEYALILALVVLIVLTSLALLGGSVRVLWEEKVPCATPTGRSDAPGHGGTPKGQCKQAQKEGETAG